MWPEYIATAFVIIMISCSFIVSCSSLAIEKVKCEELNIEQERIATVAYWTSVSCNSDAGVAGRARDLMLQDMKEDEE